MRNPLSLLFGGTVIACGVIASLNGCKSPPADPATPTPAPMAQPGPATRPMATMTAVAPVAPVSPVAPVAPVAPKSAIVALKFTPTSLDAIEAGTKTSTTRKGVRMFPGNVATAVEGGDGDRNLKLQILMAVPKRLADLTEADAKSDGSDSLDAMKTALTTSYPGLTAEDMVTVITFRVVK